MESIFQLGILLRVMDMVSGPVQAISQSIDGLAAKAEKLQPAFDRFKDYGRWIAGAGVAGAIGLGVAVTQFANLEEAQLRLRTTVMDVSGKVGPEYEKLNALAEKLGTDLPGSTKDMVQMFIALREQGVQTNQILNGMGEAAAKFAALMHLGFAESAVHVAKFSHSMGLADAEIVPFMDLLQRLKYASGVEVNELAYTFKFAGGSLKMLGLQGLDSARDFGAIVGVLARAGMEGSTAGTNLSQAFSRMAEIGHRLDRGQVKKLIGPILDKYAIKLNFFTESGEFKGLRPMIAELEKLKALNPQEQIITLKKLFGDEAARPLAILLQSGIAGYDQMLAKMRDQADMETKIKEIMSGAKMQWETLTGTVANLVAHVGGVVSKVAGLIGIMGAINDLAGRLDSWVVANPTTAGIIAGVAVALTAAALAAGSLLLAIGIGGTLITKMVVGYGLLIKAVEMVRIVSLAATPALWSMTAALLANPMTWVVAGIVAGVAILGAVFVWMYRRVEWFKTGVDGLLFFLGFGIGTIVKGWINLARWILAPFELIWSVVQRLWAAVPAISTAISDALAGMLNTIPTILGSLFTSGRKIISTLIDGIRTMAPALVTAVKEVFSQVRNLLPFSDAKEGPLSQLTLSGSRIMSTMGEGITGAAPGFHKTLATALAGAALTTSIAVEKPAFAAGPGQASRQISVERSGSGEGRKVIIQQLTVQLTNVSDAKDFISQLQELVEGFDAD
jgi:TP901 family phage tail tape measure protein